MGIRKTEEVMKKLENLLEENFPGIYTYELNLYDIEELGLKNVGLSLLVREKDGERLPMTMVDMAHEESDYQFNWIRSSGDELEKKVREYFEEQGIPLD